MPTNHLTEKAYSFLFGMLGAMLILLVSHLMFDRPKNIATVNITGLVNQFIQQESQKNVPPDRLKQEIKEFGHRLERNLKQLAAQKKLILLPNEAVIAGSHDVTNLIAHKIIVDENHDV